MKPTPAKALLTILAAPLAAASAWLLAAAGKYGIHLDKSGVNALAVAGATGGLALALKLIHDLEHKLERDHYITAAQVDHASHDLQTVVSTADPTLGAELGWPPAGTPAPAQAPAAAQAPAVGWAPSSQ